MSRNDGKESEPNGLSSDPGAPSGRKRRLGRPNRQESTAAILDRLLTRQVVIKKGDQPERVAVADAIVTGLVQNALAGNARASRVLQKYQEFAHRHSNIGTGTLTFVDDEYTRAVATSISRNDDE